MKMKSFYCAGALCLGLALTGPGIPQKELSDEALAGLWGVEQNLGPLVRGELILDARGHEWRARISGYDVPMERKGNDLRFTLSGGAGELRAHFTADAKSIMGHWIQPANAVYNLDPS